MFLKEAWLAMLVIAPSLAAHAALPVPPAGAGATEIVKFAVGYEGRADDASELLRGASRAPTDLEAGLFTRAFLRAWYDLKAKEAANPDIVSTPNGSPGIDNVTNGETDYLIDAESSGNCARKDRFDDVSNGINGTVVAVRGCARNRYVSLFFLKNEAGRLKIDDVVQGAFASDPLNPAALHRAGVSQGMRNEIERKLGVFGVSKK
ncbi:hypothetical protein GQ56_0111580 [Burkholderia paludis]|uniref:hypothetical protein n=1 Tax=Burkholderia paludis TaxID=1506587 RepID=UPI0004DB7364|nr:hypothetical protein [Burkholderia paludis]KFG97191.1 hypothetical protein GQ56_0111580 [Burkholderia paludis]